MSVNAGTRQTLPFGSWPTPITSALVVASAVGLSEVRIDGEDVIWSETRPDEGGRVQLVRRSSDGTVAELLPAGESARSAVHEYGGGAWWARSGVLWVVAWDDQRLYRIDPHAGSMDPLTPEPAAPRADRYADGHLTPDGQWIACVREQHSSERRGAAQVRNEIVRLHAHRAGVPEVLVTGPDFVASPRWSPSGDRLCWIEWDHPNMPWDGTRLVVRDLNRGEDRVIAGGPGESVSEPHWQQDGSLTFISDRTGWWNIYRFSAQGATVPLVEIAADVGSPQWSLGGSRYAVLSDGRVLFARWREGFDGLAVRLPNGTITDLDLPFSLVDAVRGGADSSVVVVAGTLTSETSVARIELGEGAAVGHIAPLRPARDLTDLGVDPTYVSVPDPLQFPSRDGRTAYGLFYAPANPAFAGPEDELPPLLLRSHGGPTGEAHSMLHLGIQYWTSRGFAVVDVNYGGSSGYGRPYRELLRGKWGVVDVDDCIAAARWLAEHRRCDPQRLCIRGSSAGGFTTLAALARKDTPFAAGADHFGVADLEALAKDTHKFESRYLDSLVGPYPQAREVYRERSPIHHVDAFSRPLIVLQGLEDEVVPPNQSKMIFEALKAKGVPVAYIAFAGEQHGFRRAENIRRALDSELSFYSQVLGFELPADEGIEPVPVVNGPGALRRA